MNFDLKIISELLQALAIAVLPVLGVMGIAYLKSLISSNLTKDKQEMLYNAVRIAVFAAEQVFGEGFGKEKKEYALGVVQAWLTAHNLSIDVSVIDAAIEAGVLEHFPKFPYDYELE